MAELSDKLKKEAAKYVWSEDVKALIYDDPTGELAYNRYIIEHKKPVKVNIKELRNTFTAKVKSSDEDDIRIYQKMNSLFGGINVNYLWSTIEDRALPQLPANCTFNWDNILKDLEEAYQNNPSEYSKSKSENENDDDPSDFTEVLSELLCDKILGDKTSSYYWTKNNEDGSLA